MAYRKSRGHTWLLLPVCVSAGVTSLVGCKDRQPDVCRIDYELVGGAPSERFDVLEVDRRRNLVTRASYPDGGALTEAIYYHFDEGGHLRIESLDRRANGDIEARLDGQDPVLDVLVPYAVDINLQDGAIDSAQYSLLVPTSMIGPWNPARIFYQLPCDQSVVSATGTGTEERTVILEATLPEGSGQGASEGSAEEGSAGAGSGFPPGTRTVMTLQFDAENRPLRWDIDLDGDGRANDTAVLVYNELGFISELYWLRPGQFFGQIYARGRWIYDTEGKLYSFELDADGDRTFESRAIYSAACFEGQEAP